jgi:nucleotide-binding universal stress UspA family protein
LKEILKDASIKYSIEIVKTVSANETLAESVIDYARKMEAGMILITSQQDNNYSQFYLSPLLQEIISISDIPVLTISSKQVSIHA